MTKIMNKNKIIKSISLLFVFFLLLIFTRFFCYLFLFIDEIFPFLELGFQIIDFYEDIFDH